MKKITLLSALLAVLVIAFLAGAFFLFKGYLPSISVNIDVGKSETQNKSTTGKSKEADATASPEDKEDKNVYKNTKYGFELTLPDHWADYNYKVSEGSYPNYSVISFSFPDGHQPFSIVQLVYYDKEQLKKLGNAPMEVIYQDDKGTLFCDSCCSAEQGFTGGGQFDEFQVARCEEVPNILKTLKPIE